MNPTSLTKKIGPTPDHTSRVRSRRLLRTLARGGAIAALAALTASAAARAELSAEEKAWNQPVQPFRIAGNVYYVGAAEVAAYLIATPDGHVILDSGFAETAPQVLANVAALGFAPRDVKWLLTTHSHYDHVGGIAELREKTGARIAVSTGDAEQDRLGGKGDFAWGDRFTFRPFTADRLLADGDRVELGGTVLTAHVTPGHTRGCTTWTTRVEEEGKPLDVLFLCSVTAPGYQLVGNQAYPRILDDYRATFRTLAALPVDVFLANHGSFFDLAGKRAALCSDASAVPLPGAGAAQRLAECGRRPAPPGSNPFVDPEGYQELLRRHRADLERKVKEQGGKPEQ